MTTVTVVVPLAIRHRGGRKAIIAPDGTNLAQVEARGGAIPLCGDPTLVKALARAHRWRGQLENGTYATVRDMANAEKVNETYICRVLRLTLLAPDIVEDILEGRQAAGLRLPMLMQGVPVEWDRQGLNSQNASLLIHTLKCPN
jgi:hypothetical protein